MSLDCSLSLVGLELVLEESGAGRWMRLWIRAGNRTRLPTLVGNWIQLELVNDEIEDWSC